MARVRVWLTFSSMSVTPDFTSSISFWKIVNILYTDDVQDDDDHHDHLHLVQLGEIVHLFFQSVAAYALLSQLPTEIFKLLQNQDLKENFTFEFKTFLPPTVLRLKTLD